MDLESLELEAPLVRNRETWSCVAAALDVGLMPPEGMAQPSDAEHRQMFDSLEATLESFDYSTVDVPGLGVDAAPDAHGVRAHAARPHRRRPPKDCLKKTGSPGSSRAHGSGSMPAVPRTHGTSPRSRCRGIQSEPSASKAARADDVDASLPRGSEERLDVGWKLSVGRLAPLGPEVVQDVDENQGKGRPVHVEMFVQLAIEELVFYGLQGVIVPAVTVDFA